MACVDVETPSTCRSRFRSALHVRLQQRCTREQLIRQGVVPSLKTPTDFHKQIRSLERERTENFLKHKIRRRPECSELVHMHILQETLAEASLQATQLKLKRTRLTDRLSKKLAQHPGPLALVEKNILPIDSTVKETLNAGEAGCTEAQDVYSFDDDSGDALSKEQLANQRPPSEEPKPTDVANPALKSCPPLSQAPADFLSVSEQLVHRPVAASQLISMASPAKAGTTLVKHSLPKQVTDRGQRRKVHDGRPKMRKLKYHQYVPPDQKPGSSKLSMDSSYGHLLQQQQLFLQLQILGQQQQPQQHGGYHAPTTLVPLTSVAEGQKESISEAMSGNESLSSHTVVPHPSSTQSRANYDPVSSNSAQPVNLSEMKVARLRQELKLRRLPVSGTKAELIERLRPFQEGLAAGSPAEAPESASPAPLPSVSPARSEDGDQRSQGEQDEQLREKERQIEELKRRLQQEKRRVEELRKQLQGVERRGQWGAGSSPTEEEVKEEEEEEEHRARSPSCSAPTLPAVVKQEELLSNPHPGPPETLPDNQILLPVSSTALLLLSNNASQQVFPACTTSRSGCGLSFRAGDNGAQSFPNGSKERGPLSISSLSHALPNGPTYRSAIPNDHTPKAKDPPRYEEAVKQTRSLQAQVPMVTSQPMDDLFDILMESGEISPTVRQRLSSTLVTPVTASISTLPVSSALSRPPPQVQVAPPTPTFDPALTLDHRLAPGPIPVPVTLASDQQLEAFLKETLAGGAERAGPQTLNCPLLDSPMADALPLCPEFELQVGGEDMEWLELPVTVGPGEVLGSVSPLDILPPDLMDGHGFQLHWN